MSDLSEKTQRLISLLKEQTETGQQSWEEGSADTEYVFVQDAGSLVILVREGNEDAPFELRILDPDGDVVERHDSGEAGGELLEGLYEAARNSSGLTSARIVEALLAELDKPPDVELLELMDTTIKRVKAAPNMEEKVALIKPLLRKRIEHLRAANTTSLQWPQLIEPFPSGGGVRNALTQAFKELRQSGEVACIVNPEPQGDQGFGGGKVIQFDFS